MISDYSKIVGYKDNIQKSIAFHDKQVEFEIRNTIRFSLAPPK